MILFVMLAVMHALPKDPMCDDEEACRQACKRGDLTQCQALADSLLGDDRDQALKLYEANCTKGLARSCGKLARAVDVEGADHTRSIKLAEKACAGDDAIACANLALWLQDHVGPPAFKRAFSAATKSCQLGDLYGCDTAGTMLMEGKGVEEDRKKGLAMLEEACSKGIEGSGPSCTSLGVFTRDGVNGLAVDLKKAFNYLTLGCNDDFSPGCLALSEAHQRGLGTRRDRRKAEALRSKACDLGLLEACPGEDEPDEPAPGETP